MAVKRKFNFALAVLSLNGKAILECVRQVRRATHRAPAGRARHGVARLPDDRDRCHATQKQKTGDVGDLTDAQNAQLKELRRLMGKARDFAGRAFKGQTVKLHEEFQVGEHKDNTLGAIVERAQIILASCQKTANVTPLADKGWIDADNTELSDAIDALSGTDETQETGKGERKLDTNTVNTAANNLYDGLLDVQVIANARVPRHQPHERRQARRIQN